jgi:hypothetical protein
MSWMKGLAQDAPDFLAQVDAFLCVGHALEPSYSADNGGELADLIGTSSSVAEQVTVTFSGATAFSVSGTVSGSLGSGTVGTPFASSVAAFTAVAGDTPWASGDTVSFAMSPPWTQLRGVTTPGTEEYVWMAPGNDGASQVFVGMLRTYNAAYERDGAALMGSTGFDGSLAFASQPNAITDLYLPLMYNLPMPFWVVANGRRMVVVAKCSTVYESAYLGWLRNYQNPGQYPYPMAVGGSTNTPTDTMRWSLASTAHVAYPFCAVGNPTMKTRNAYGNTSASAASPSSNTFSVWPFTLPSLLVRANLDGSVPLFPAVVYENFSTTTRQMAGEVEGVFMPPQSMVCAENEIKVGRTRYMCVPDVWRNTPNDFYALKLA